MSLYVHNCTYTSAPQWLKVEEEYPRFAQNPHWFAHHICQDLPSSVPSSPNVLQSPNIFAKVAIAKEISRIGGSITCRVVQKTVGASTHGAILTSGTSNLLANCSETTW